jgi:hypothetical protein
MFRKFAAIVAVGMLGAMASSSRADTYVAANLTGVSPSLATATLNGSGNFYAGLLNWNVVATSNSSVFAVGSNFNTYCVDISHDIGIGGTYQYDLTSLGSAAALAGKTYTYGAGSVSMVEAIDTLYSQFYGQSTTATLTYSADQEAAAFQGAVWTVLFTPPNSIGLGDAGATTLEGDELAALDTQLATGGLDAYNVMALEADPSGPLPYNVQGQDQALVVMPTFGSSPVPLPSASMGGCVLLGLFGLGAASKKRFATAQ